MGVCSGFPGNLNLLVVSGDYGWKSQDQILLNKLVQQLGSKPYICLNNAPKYDIENFTGMLPPYTPFKKATYRLSQLSIREFFKQWKDYLNLKKTGAKEIDNDD